MAPSTAGWPVKWESDLTAEAHWHARFRQAFAELWINMARFELSQADCRLECQWPLFIKMLEPEAEGPGLSRGNGTWTVAIVTRRPNLSRRGADRHGKLAPLSLPLFLFRRTRNLDSTVALPGPDPPYAGSTEPPMG